MASTHTVSDQPRAASSRGPRSPNFPAITLPDALAKVRILYEKDKRAPVGVQTVLTHLGFGNKLSGSTARVLSALRQFGLLEQVGEQFRVTDQAYRMLVLSEGSPDRVKAVQEAAKKPAIYRELLDQYPEGLPSDAALKDFLISSKKFNPASVETFLRVFHASLEFAKLTSSAHNGSAQTEGGKDVDDASRDEIMDFERSESAKNPPASAIPPMSWVLSVPRGVRAELKIIGADVKVADLQRLKQQIDFLVASFEDEAGGGGE
jgi:hypothetical protein